MKDNIQIFESSEFGKLEVLTIDGKPYFPASDCAKILGYTNPNAAVIRHCKGILKRDTLSAGGIQSINFIPEGDLYRLIIRSKLPAAVRFEAWVMDVVLPSIRKHSAYISDDLLNQLIDNPESATKLFARLKDERAQMAALEGQVEQLTPKGHYYDIILQCPGAVLTTVIAKDYATLGADPSGNITRINNAFDKIPERLRAVETQLAAIHQQIGSAKAELEKPFAQEAELTEKSSRLAALDALLNMDDKPEAEHDGSAVEVSAAPEKEAAKRPSMAENYARAGARMAAAEAGRQADKTDYSQSRKVEER